MTVRRFTCAWCLTFVGDVESAVYVRAPSPAFHVDDDGVVALHPSCAKAVQRDGMAEVADWRREVARKRELAAAQDQIAEAYREHAEMMDRHRANAAARTAATIRQRAEATEQAERELRQFAEGSDRAAFYRAGADGAGREAAKLRELAGIVERQCSDPAASDVRGRAQVAARTACRLRHHADDDDVIAREIEGVARQLAEDNGVS
jgi:hypothetical protein